MKRICLALISFLVAVLVGIPLVAAQKAQHGYSQKIFSELHWRLIGPGRAGRSVAVAGVPGQPDVYYFGAVDGGVWKTDDAGRTWKPIFDSENVASIGAIAVAPTDPRIIYVGTGESDLRSSLSSGNGMYRSDDGGKTWKHIGLEDSRHIARILVDPKDPNHVYVAALGHAYASNAERGVFESMDGGATWKKILYCDENTGAIDLAFEPGNPKTIYASLLQTRRPPWSIYPPSKGPGTGLFRSKDGGAHWEQVSGHGLPSEELGRIGIAFAPSNPKRIYLIVDAKKGGLYRSDDAGENWALECDDHRIWERGWYFGELSVDPKDENTLYVMDTSTYKSTDGGQSFTAFKGAPGGDDYHELWIDPVEPRRMVLSSDQGVIVTRNGGETWSSWYNQPTGQFYHVNTDNRFPYWVYGAEQDSGALATPSRSNYRKLNFHDWKPIDAGGENGYIAPDPLHPGVIFGGTLSREILDDGQNRQMPPSLAHVGNFRTTWTMPLVFSPIAKSVLYFGSQVLFRTADGGNSWQVISPDLTREDPGVPANLDAATAADAPAGKRRGIIYTVAPSPIKAGEIWAGTDDGLIQLTQDEGKTWKNVTPPQVSAWSKVTHIEASHFEPGVAYAAVDRHRLDDNRPYLYRTRDFGKNWTESTSGIPAGNFLNCIREDPDRKGLLYACTETGVYVSFDDGDQWQSLHLNMPTVSVRDLVVHGNDLVIATFGRGLWILDDATPLRQFKPVIQAKAAWLFKPETAYRIRPGSDEGTPLPFDEPAFENAPTGAAIDYYLKEKPSGPIRLEILDAAGKPVRRYSSEDKLEEINPTNVPFPKEWIRKPQALSAEAGAHRFYWELFFSLLDGTSGFFGRPGAVWVVPGDYRVKLTVNGQSYEQQFSVKMDPRVKVSQSDLEKQCRLATKLSDQFIEVSSSLGSELKLYSQIDARKKEATGDPDLMHALEMLKQKLNAGRHAGGQAEFGLFGSGLPGNGGADLQQVSSGLGKLFFVVESADAAPTKDAETAAARWEAAASAALARWHEVQKTDLPQVNDLLTKAHLEKLQY